MSASCLCYGPYGLEVKKGTPCKAAGYKKWINGSIDFGSCTESTNGVDKTKVALFLAEIQGGRGEDSAIKKIQMKLPYNWWDHQVKS